MSLRRRHGCLIGLALGCVLVLGLAPTAFAKKKPKDPNAIYAVKASSLVGAESVDPTCPKGMRAVGGGFSGANSFFAIIGGRMDIIDVVVVYESRRSGPRSWRTSAILMTPPGNAKPVGIDAFVQCRRFKGKVTEVAAVGPTAVDPAASSSATATCPRRQTPIAGGFSTSPVPAPGPGLPHPSIYENLPVGTWGWRASATPWTQNAVGVTSYAYCVRGKPLVTQIGSTSDGLYIGTPPCPRHLQASAGGFQNPPNSGSLGSPPSASWAPEAHFNQVSYGVPYRVGTTWLFGGRGSAFALCS